MSEPTPEDFMSVLAQNAAMTHEVFMAYMAAGFSHDDALAIVIAITTAGISNQAAA